MAEQPKEHEEDMRGALGSGNDDDDSDDDVTNRYGVSFFVPRSPRYLHKRALLRAGCHQIRH